MTWQFFIGTLDPSKLTRENMVFAIACDPDKIATMMDGLDSLPADEEAQLHADIAKLKATRQGIILGHNHLRATNKRIGERLKLTGMSISKGIDLEFEIVGAFPAGPLRHDGRLQPRLLRQRLRRLSRPATTARNTPGPSGT